MIVCQILSTSCGIYIKLSLYTILLSQLWVLEPTYSKVLSNLWLALQLNNAHQSGVAVKKNVLNTALHIVTGCLHSTPTDNSLTCELVFGSSIYPCTNVVPLKKSYATNISMLYYQPPHGGYSLTVWDDKILQPAYNLSSTAAWNSNKKNFQSKYCLCF